MLCTDLAHKPVIGKTVGSFRVPHKQYMKRTLFLTLVASFVAGTALADWPQWRGPLRNGTIPESIDLPDELTEANAPLKVWESEEVPSDIVRRADV